jgi:GNAT superfamily N-acetyltransferase
MKPNAHRPESVDLAPDEAGARVMIVAVDLNRAEHRSALLTLLDEYARTPEGGGSALDPAAMARLCDVLAARDHYTGWLAFLGDQPVGLINCFEGVSTFRALPLLNIHDIVVTLAWRRRGIGRRLIEAAESGARERGCCKLTLEVLEGNRLPRKETRLTPRSSNHAFIRYRL